jgi:TRAP-type C4-dicarboxylate transport system substrate-binding protein
MTKFIKLPLVDGTEQTINVGYIRKIYKPLTSTTTYTHLTVVMNPDVYDQLTTTIPYDVLLQTLNHYGVEIIEVAEKPTV